MDRQLNRLVCVLIGFVPFELPEPNGDGKERYLVNLLSCRGALHAEYLWKHKKGMFLCRREHTSAFLRIQLGILSARYCLF